MQDLGAMIFEGKPAWLMLVLITGLENGLIKLLKVNALQFLL